MTRIQTIERLTKNLALGLLINVIATALLVHIFYGSISAGLEGKEAVTLISGLSVLWVVFLMICSLTVFLNLYIAVRANKIYTLLTYFLLPVIAVIAALSIEDSEATPLILVASTPFFITQTFFFARFIKATKIA